MISRGGMFGEVIEKRTAARGVPSGGPQAGAEVLAAHAAGGVVGVVAWHVADLVHAHAAEVTPTTAGGPF